MLEDQYKFPGSFEKPENSKNDEKSEKFEKSENPGNHESSKNQETSKKGNNTEIKIENFSSHATKTEVTSEKAANLMPTIENQTWNNIAECPTTPIGESTIDVMCDLYKQLGDDDLYYSICREKAVFPATQYALEFHSQYLFEKSQTLTEQLINESVNAIKNPENSVLAKCGGNPRQDQMLGEIQFVQISIYSKFNLFNNFSTSNHTIQIYSQRTWETSRKYQSSRSGSLKLVVLITSAQPVFTPRINFPINKIKLLQNVLRVTPGQFHTLFTESSSAVQFQTEVLVFVRSNTAQTFD